MTGCHLRRCHPPLIRQTGIGLAAGILCFLVLSYSDPSARKDEPEVGRSLLHRWRLPVCLLLARMGPVAPQRR